MIKLDLETKDKEVYSSYGTDAEYAEAESKFLKSIEKVEEKDKQLYLDIDEYSEVAEPPTLLKWSHLFHYEEPVN